MRIIARSDWKLYTLFLTFPQSDNICRKNSRKLSMDNTRGMHFQGNFTCQESQSCQNVMNFSYDHIEYKLQEWKENSPAILKDQAILPCKPWQCSKNQSWPRLTDIWIGTLGKVNRPGNCVNCCSAVYLVYGFGR